MTVEQALIAGGCECGTTKKFNECVLRSMKLNRSNRWFFRTPDDPQGDGLKSVKLGMAFPFIANNRTDLSESIVITKLSPELKKYKDELVLFLRKLGFIVPPDMVNFTIIPFWAGENGYREDLANFGGVVIHIYNAVLTVKYRESWFINQ